MSKPIIKLDLSFYISMIVVDFGPTVLNNELNRSVKIPRAIVIVADIS